MLLVLPEANRDVVVGGDQQPEQGQDGQGQPYPVQEGSRGMGHLGHDACQFQLGGAVRAMSAMARNRWSSFLKVLDSCCFLR